MQVRLEENLGNIQRGFKGQKVSRHYATVHNKDPTGTLFLGKDKCILHWQGSALTKDLQARNKVDVMLTRIFLLV